MEYKWPYKNEMGEEERIACDVLVLGGGMAGCYIRTNGAAGSGTLKIEADGMPDVVLEFRTELG